MLQPMFYVGEPSSLVQYHSRVGLHASYKLKSVNGWVKKNQASNQNEYQEEEFIIKLRSQQLLKCIVAWRDFTMQLKRLHHYY